jgi:hypothetical protein
MTRVREELSGGESRRIVITTAGARYTTVPKTHIEVPYASLTFRSQKSGGPYIYSGAQTRTIAALQTAIADTLAAITVKNARAWFTHCGYGLR